MKNNTLKTLQVAAMALCISVTACKSRKAAQPYKPPVPLTENSQEEKKEEKAPAPATTTETPAAAENSSAAPRLDFNFKNIQFEFNSAVLKTSSYPVLDEVSIEMKQAPSARFVINGHSSAEGTPEHNQSLSVDRANAVKSYLVNAGVSGANLSVKGFGESMPVAKNDTEAGRALNRRVEIKKAD